MEFCHPLPDGENVQQTWTDSKEKSAGSPKSTAFALQRNRLFFPKGGGQKNRYGLNSVPVQGVGEHNLLE